MSGGSGKKVLAGVLAVGCLAPVGLAGGALVLGLAMFADEDDADPAALCSDTSLSVQVDGEIPAVDGYTSEQLERAAIIVAVGKEEGIPARGQLVALMTAMQESTLGTGVTNGIPWNQPNGDGDAGMFQQRQFPGWYGTLEEVNDPAYSARTFYKGKDIVYAGPESAGPEGYHLPGLVDIDGWEAMPLTKAAQKVQRSGFPLAYAKREPDARAILSAVSGVNVTVDQNEAGAGLCGADTVAGEAGGAAAATGTRADVIELAKTTLGTDYELGAGGYNGPTNGQQDCSGLTTYVYQQKLGIRIPRQAKMQWAALRSYEVQPSEIQPGDLVFERWGRLGNDVSHVTMYIGNGQVIEASRSADVTRITDARLGSRGFVGIARVPDGFKG